VIAKRPSIHDAITASSSARPTIWPSRSCRARSSKSRNAPADRISTN
jgi:hypothetical protein